MDFRNFTIPFEVNPDYKKRVAYFSMEFAVDQPLKIYSGGLGFLAGSHMRSAYTLKQDLVGIGILWKYGYYDQARNPDQTLNVAWTEKSYNFSSGYRYKISDRYSQCSGLGESMVSGTGNFRYSSYFPFVYRYSGERLYITNDYTQTL